MKKLKLTPIVFVMFHVVKTLLFTMKNTPDVYKDHELELPRYRSKIDLKHMDKKSDRLYLLLMYSLGRKYNQQKLGLRTYRIMRVLLKMFVYNSKFDSNEDRFEEYQYMLQSTKLW